MPIMNRDILSLTLTTFACTLNLLQVMYVTYSI